MYTKSAAEFEKSPSPRKITNLNADYHMEPHYATFLT